MRRTIMTIKFYDAQLSSAGEDQWFVGNGNLSRDLFVLSVSVGLLVRMFFLVIP